jgi:hypothetical protein
MTDWKMDGWVRCPGCGAWLDGAVAFGDVEGDDIGIEDGTHGDCDSCGARIVVILEVRQESK